MDRVFEVLNFGLERKPDEGIYEEGKRGGNKRGGTGQIIFEKWNIGMWKQVIGKAD